MLRSAKGLNGSMIRAQDGDIGKVSEFLFDDEHWTIRYIVVDTGSWLSERKTLISPLAIGGSNWQHKTLDVHLTREQVENSPGADTHKPVSRQWETEYYDFYAWPYYWGGTGTWGSSGYPSVLALQPRILAGLQPREQEERPVDPADEHLRSTNEVTGYGIHASDGHLGHVEDFILDDETWAIRYLAVDTRNWWPGKKVLLPPRWIGQVDWSDGSVTVALSRDQVRGAPQWESDESISRAYEEKLHDYYGKQGYWSDPKEGPA